jgi:hypothetical protein
LKPGLNDVLSAISARLATEVLPNLPPGYAQSDAMVLALLLAGAAEEHDRAAEIRMQDIDELRAILRTAAATLSDDTLRNRARDGAAREPASLRVTDLDRCLDALLGVLIDVHVAIESRSETWARGLEADIWSHLRASVKRRSHSTNPF